MMSSLKTLILSSAIIFLFILSLLFFVNVDKVGNAEIILYETKEYIVLNKKDAFKNINQNNKKYDFLIDNKNYLIEFTNFNDLIKDEKIDYVIYPLKRNFNKSINCIENDFNDDEILTNGHIIYGKQTFFNFIFCI
ncbi:MAG: hypothetical protein LBF02_03000 [Mycoplasmataceae bacterium]|jgi:hypothetical protein|nr:hypothetical protein [Mycoplasmataceae bacterium]